MPRAASQSRSAGGKASPPSEAFRSDGRATPGLVGLLEQDAQEARRADVAVGPQVGHRLQLQFGLAGAGREDRAADAPRAPLSIIAPAGVKW